MSGHEERSRLFQTVGAAMRKAREPNDKLDTITIKPASVITTLT